MMCTQHGGMMQFKPTKKLQSLLERHYTINNQAENLIKERIAKVCKKQNLRYSGYCSTFMDSENNEIENVQIKEIHNYITWFEQEWGTNFDPQCIFENGEWC